MVNGRSRQSVDEAAGRIQTAQRDAKIETAVGNSATAEGCNVLISACPDVDVLIVNLGIYEAVDIYKAGDDRWYELIETNVMSGVRLSRHYLPKMLKRNAGRVVFMASESGINPAPEDAGLQRHEDHAIVAGPQSCRDDEGNQCHGEFGLPGPCSTEGVSKLIAGLYPGVPKGGCRAPVRGREPPDVAHSASLAPEEVADFVTFLASSRTGIVNGAALRIDGGLIRTVF